MFTHAPPKNRISVIPSKEVRQLATQAHIMIEKLVRQPYAGSLLKRLIGFCEACLDYKANRSYSRGDNSPGEYGEAA